jgi:hypothetical protein
MDRLTVVCGSHRPHLVLKVQESCPTHDVIHIDGTGAKSFSWLVNKCIRAHPSDYVIICSDRAYPTDLDVERMQYLLQQDFGFVTFLGLGFFGLHKSLIKQIGWFDERFIKGNHEDNDWFLRLGEKDISIYQDYSVKYDWNLGSAWQNISARQHFNKKWKITPNSITRLLPEEEYGYELRDVKKRHFRPMKDSIVKQQTIDAIFNKEWYK